MKSSSFNTSVNPYLQSSQCTRTFINSKPPVPPKPIFTNSHKGIENNSIFVGTANNILNNCDVYSIQSAAGTSIPTAVLIKDENIANGSIDLLSPTDKFPTLSPLLPISLSPKYPHDANLSNISLQDVIPPLTKAETISSKSIIPITLAEFLKSNEGTNLSTNFDKVRAGPKNAFLQKEISGTSSSIGQDISSSRNISKAESVSFLNPVSINNCYTIHEGNFSNFINSSKKFTSEKENKTSHKSGRRKSSHSMQNNLKNVNYFSSNQAYDSNIPGNSSINLPLIDLPDSHENRLLNGSFSVNSEIFCDNSEYNLNTSSNGVTISHSTPCSPVKPPLQKIEALDDSNLQNYRRFSRGISRANDNINIVLKAQSEIALRAINDGSITGQENSPIFLETPLFTFTLPDLSIYSDEFRLFLEKDLIETSTLSSLENAGRLNWWYNIGALQRLWPLSTTGDGNCLLHAASLGMWGFHDRLLTLRKSLHNFLTRSQYSRSLWRRWRWQTALQNKQTGLVLSVEEWEAEWASVLQLSSSAPRVNHSCNDVSNSSPNLSQQNKSENCDVVAPVYESLEDIHVLALAHVLKRPIIVVADTFLKDMNGDPLAPITFGGIYLPLEMAPCECQRSPLLLTYDAAHFSALVNMETSDDNLDFDKPKLPVAIPLSDPNHIMLPIQFMIDPGEEFCWGRDEFDPTIISHYNVDVLFEKQLLSAYLDLVEIPVPSAYLDHHVGPTPSNKKFTEPDLTNLNPVHLFDLPRPFDLESRPSDFSFDSDDSHALSEGCVPVGSKLKGSGQLNNVARSFGSIGRNMSKKIKKNLNSLSKFSRSNSFRRKNDKNTTNLANFVPFKGIKDFRVAGNQNFILCAQIHSPDKRQTYQEEMISNYLTLARKRFMTPIQKTKSTNQNITTTFLSNEKNDTDLQGEISNDVVDCNTSNQLRCVNSNCDLFGSIDTAYMCFDCFNKQKEKETEYQFKSGTKTEKQLKSGKTENHFKSSNKIESNIANLDHKQEIEQVNTVGKIQSEGGGKMLLKEPFSGDTYTGSGLQYGTGRSKFYTALDGDSVQNANLIPVNNSLFNNRDQTLFLSNSTFFNDGLPNITSYNLANASKNLSRSNTTESEASLKGSKESSSNSSDTRLLPENDRKTLPSDSKNDRRALLSDSKNDRKALPSDSTVLNVLPCGTTSKTTVFPNKVVSLRQKNSTVSLGENSSNLTPVNYINDPRISILSSSVAPKLKNVRPYTEPSTHVSSIRSKESKACRNKGCEFFGTSSSDFFCSKCHLLNQRSTSFM